VTHQRVTQIVAERDDFPKPAKVIGRHRFVAAQGRGAVVGRPASRVDSCRMSEQRPVRRPASA
jgi:hypothetical protein